LSETTVVSTLVIETRLPGVISMRDIFTAFDEEAASAKQAIPA